MCRRTRGSGTQRRSSVWLSHRFFIVAVSLSPSPPTSTTAENRTPLSTPASTPALQQASPAITPLPALTPAPELAPAPAVSPVAAAPPLALAPAPGPAHAAVPVPAPAAAPASPAAPPTAGSPMRSTHSSTGNTSAGSTGETYYANCAAARTAGVALLQKGDPGYRSGLDRDDDGTACE